MSLTLDEQTKPVAPPVTDQERTLLKPWLRRRDDARADRKPYELQWMVNQNFAAGIQWLNYSPRDHRVLQQIKDDSGRLLDTVDVLSPYIQTVIGKLASGELRPELLCSWDNDDVATQYTQQLNDGVDFAWNEECQGDRKMLALLRILVELGTGAIRCRYDRSRGKLIAPDVPFVNGQPILDKAAQAKHMDTVFSSGGHVDLRPLREGQIVWELLSAWNLLPPPGVEFPWDFPWHLVVRPVALTELQSIYGAKALGVTADNVEEMGMLSYQTAQRTDLQQGGGLGQKSLKDHALVYTGYLKPNDEHPNGQSVVFSNNGRLLDSAEGMPYTADPWGPRPGISYFRWQTLSGRFWGRAFVESGVGPQKVRNKRLSQTDEIIDRGLPVRFYEEGTFAKLPQSVPGEYVKVRQGAKLPVTDGGVAPGSWMYEDIRLQDDNIERALGMHQATLGDNPSAVGNYSQLALLTENDAIKLDPIAQDFALGVADVVRDTVEAMRQWPADKQLLLAGDENKLRVASFNSEAATPAAYLVRPARKGSLPRGQGAQVQKVTDIWNAAVACGAVLQKPAEWIEWYKQSLDAGQAQELPTADDPNLAQRHKAALENVVMARTGQVLPVADYDNHQIHVLEHRDEEMRLQQALDLGDQTVAQALQALQQHCQLHQQQAQLNALQNQQPPGPPGLPAAPTRSLATTV